MKPKKLARTLHETGLRTPSFAFTLAAWQGERRISAIISLDGITPEVIEKTGRRKDFVRVLRDSAIQNTLFRLVSAGSLATRATEIRNDVP
jgi:hypothetical protein